MMLIGLNIYCHYFVDRCRVYFHSEGQSSPADIIGEIYLEACLQEWIINPLDYHNAIEGMF